MTAEALDGTVPEHLLEAVKAAFTQGPTVGPRNRKARRALGLANRATAILNDSIDWQGGAVTHELRPSKTAIKRVSGGRVR